MIGEKIRQLRTQQSISQKDFAKLFGISYGALQSYEYGDTQPKPSLLQSIADYFNVNMSFFYDEKRSAVANQDLMSKISVINSSYSKNSEDIVNLRYFENVSASAGYGFDNDSENFISIPVSKAFLSMVLKVPAAEYDVIKIAGDSMEPFIKDGDTVLVQRDVRPKSGDTVIANLGGNLYVKKFLFDPMRNIVKLTSLNKFYQDITIKDDELEQLYIIGRVKARFCIDIKIF